MYQRLLWCALLLAPALGDEQGRFLLSRLDANMSTPGNDCKLQNPPGGMYMSRDDGRAYLASGVAQNGSLAIGVGGVNGTYDRKTKTAVFTSPDNTTQTTLSAKKGNLWLTYMYTKDANIFSCVFAAQVISGEVLDIDDDDFDDDDVDEFGVIQAMSVNTKKSKGDVKQCVVANGVGSDLFTRTGTVATLGYIDKSSYRTGIFDNATNTATFAADALSPETVISYDKDDGNIEVLMKMVQGGVASQCVLEAQVVAGSVLGSKQDFKVDGDDDVDDDAQPHQPPLPKPDDGDDPDDDDEDDEPDDDDGDMPMPMPKNATQPVPVPKDGTQPKNGTQPMPMPKNATQPLMPPAAAGRGQPPPGRKLRRGRN